MDEIVIEQPLFDHILRKRENKSILTPTLLCGEYLCNSRLNGDQVKSELKSAISSRPKLAFREVCRDMSGHRTTSEDNMSNLMTAQQVADLMQISIRTLSRRRADGSFDIEVINVAAPHDPRMLPRFRREDVEEYLARRIDA